MGMIEREIEAILHASHDNIVITDEKGCILRASQNCRDIYGHDVSNLVGQTVYELQKRGIFSPSVTIEVLKKKKEVQLMQKTETGKVVMATGIPVYDENQCMKRVISFSHDLTELQRLKEDYQQLEVKMKTYQLEVEELREQQSNDMVIRSESMKKVWSIINRVADSDATVVLLGESGVGKTAFARALHYESERKEEPFIEINCGAIPSSLFESEMFGYEAGSFTGASTKGKIGKFELAHNGTLFLDEVGELPLDMQVKLLKVLQEKTVTKIGSERANHVNFRLIVATNQPLEEMIKKGTFREDLFYRLHVIPITIPPLRERKEDVAALLYHVLHKQNEKYKMKKFFHAEALNLLVEHHWPGNVRELENTIERLVLTTDENSISPQDLPFYSENSSSEKEEWESLDTLTSQGMTLQQALAEVEKNWLIRAYRQCQTTYEMANALGISQPTVVRRLRKYNIK
ncbi:sigma-54 interaction domain-containing protein [Priestia megaterium]|uniref:sigma-54 interaction domain-containing protein n=1 Tax=Priestia megaterium TaxID=1404 RepID=UPI00159C885E|nr:sigma 54-interacting transcriptional regulator [Priestia megaterium]